MGWIRGLEPPASGATIRRSNQLSYIHHSCVEMRKHPTRSCGGGAESIVLSQHIVKGQKRFSRPHRSYNDFMNSKAAGAESASGMSAPESGADAAPNRFDRQIRFARMGLDGQRAIEGSRVLLVGCGALGGVLAQSLTRAGVGDLVLVDRDVVELTNLPRQVLFEERHASAGTPKVEAALETLGRIGGPTQFETHAAHVDSENLSEFAQKADLILDGTDNMATRYLINDWSVKTGTPWIYGGVVGSAGLVLAVLPGTGPCLRCVFPEPPPIGSLETCDTAGVIMPAVGLIASMQAGLAMRVLAEPSDFQPALIELDAWSGTVRELRLERRSDCPACGTREFPFLDVPEQEQAISLCGRNTVQVRGRAGSSVDLARLASRLEPLAKEVRLAGPLLRVRIEELVLTVFPDGRALIEGTDQAERALAIYDRFIGA
jgi:molybdopterin/thiamine biosynthesis adenylyltransferase